jgi:hypothetical protein
MLSHNNLSNYYRNIFALTQHHGYKISDVENMIIYELDIFSTLIAQFVKEQQMKQNQEH